MSNAVSYAEETLGVHKVWEEAQERLGLHSLAKSEYLEALKAIRSYESGMADRVATLVAEQRGLNPDMKVTAFREHMKAVEADDEAMKVFHTSLALAKDERDEAEQEMRHHELGLRALTARMTELAGLLEFYAAAKAQQP